MSYVSEVLADSPYFYWRLDETSGTVAEDVSPNNRDGTYVNSPTLGASGLVPGAPGNAMSVDAGIAPQRYAISTFILNTSLVTIECWAKFPSLPAASTRGFLIGFGNGYGSGTHDKVLFIDENGKLGFYVYDGAARFTSTPTDALSVNTAYHLVGLYDGTRARAYVNGNEVGSVISGATATNYTQNDVVVGGDMSGNTLEKFAATIDEVAVWNTNLSQTRLLAHYVAGRGGTRPLSLAGPTTLGTSAATLFTVPTGDTCRIDTISVSNPTAGAVDLTLSIGTDAAGTRLFDGYPIRADSEFTWHPWVPLSAGEIVQAFASAAGSLVISIEGTVF